MEIDAKGNRSGSVETNKQNMKAKRDIGKMKQRSYKSNIQERRERKCQKL